MLPLTIAVRIVSKTQTTLTAINICWKLYCAEVMPVNNLLLLEVMVAMGYGVIANGRLYLPRIAGTPKTPVIMMPAPPPPQTVTCDNGLVISCHRLLGGGGGTKAWVYNFARPLPHFVAGKSEVQVVPSAVLKLYCTLCTPRY